MYPQFRRPGPARHGNCHCERTKRRWATGQHARMATSVTITSLLSDINHLNQQIKDSLGNEHGHPKDVAGELRQTFTSSHDTAFDVCFENQLVSHRTLPTLHTLLDPANQPRKQKPSRHRSAPSSSTSTSALTPATGPASKRRRNSSPLRATSGGSRRWSARSSMRWSISARASRRCGIPTRVLMSALSGLLLGPWVC